MSKHRKASPRSLAPFVTTGLAGVALPQTLEGDDLSALVTGSGPGPDRAALFMSVSPFIPKLQEYRGIRTKRHSFVRNLAGAWLLFDNQADPYQMHNLAEDPASAESRRDLDAMLDVALKRAGDEFRPRQFYLDRWGYSVAPQDSISYAPNAKVQSPRLQTQPKP